MQSPAASRFHARAERRKRGWYLVDRSSNGTLVESDAGPAKKLQREDLRIEGSGSFRVGDTENAWLDEPIHYELRDLENS